jgi:hypothetical protein
LRRISICNCCTCSRPLLAHFTKSLRCGDHVWLQRHLHRRGQASGMRARDPQQTTRLRRSISLNRNPPHTSGNAGTFMPLHPTTRNYLRPVRALPSPSKSPEVSEVRCPRGLALAREAMLATSCCCRSYHFMRTVRFVGRRNNGRPAAFSVRAALDSRIVVLGKPQLSTEPCPTFPVSPTACRSAAPHVYRLRWSPRLGDSMGGGHSSLG